MTAIKLLGKSPEELCRAAIPEYKLLHCENVLRNDLAKRFLAYQRCLRRRLEQFSVSILRKYVPFEHRCSSSGAAGAEQLIDYITQQKIAYHGTNQANVPSIVRNGFLKPGDKNREDSGCIKVVHGTSYGKVIYSSPHLDYTQYYSPHEEAYDPSELPGIKIFVCAIVMGRTATVDRLPQHLRTGKPIEGVDGHASHHGFEYVAFDQAQIVPCFVLHLDFSDKRASELQKLAKQAANNINKLRKPRKKPAYMTPGEVQREEEERIARGKKFFAYGFGPVSGKNLVIEEVGQVDDDEENYGDYQKNRLAWDKYEQCGREY